MSALPPLNWQRVSSSEDNSVLLIPCISGGELNHLPALFTCHLIDEANGPAVNIITPQQLEMLLPLACAWAVGQERAIVQSGVALSESQLADARRVGIAQP